MPVRAIRALGHRVLWIARGASPACAHARWIPLAILIGTVPLALSVSLQLPGHQLATAVLLAIGCLGCVPDDAWLKGVALIALTFVSHSLLAIAFSCYLPERSAAVMPQAEAYWEEQKVWIETGHNREYELMSWLPAHLRLLGGATLYSATSFGVLTFLEGFRQVDMMNYYNGRLLGRSVNRPKALALGWHLWSILRGVGYVFLTFEVISLAVQWLSGLRVSAWTTRRLRWSLGLFFVLGDGLLKYVMVEAVRWELFSNLRS